MKRKSVLVGLLSLTAVLGLASCGGNNSTTTAPSSTVAPSATTTTVVPSTTTTVVPSTPSSTVDPTEETKELIDTALSQLEISGTIESSTLTLKTTGIGGVRFSYTSSNPDVISITEGAATVNRPAFGEEDATVTITAIGILDDVESSKTFTVTVKALVDDSIRVSEIKSSKTGTAIKAHGVVSGILFAANSTTGEKYRAGFYLTDSTGTIYVYGSQVAANVSVGNEVYFSGSVNEHNSIKQISSPANLKVLSETSTVDWTSVVKDKTIVDVKNLGAEACGNVYELTILVYKNDYNVYAIEDIDYQTSKVSLNEYFSGTVSTDNTDYAPWLQGKEGKILKVYYMVNSLNSKGVPRGNVLNVLPLSETEQDQYISKELDSLIALDSKYTKATEITLPTTVEGYPSYALSWSLGEKSTGATIENGKLTITPTDSLQKFTLTVTASREGAEPVTYSFAEVQVKNSFEPMTFEKYNSLAANESVYIEGKVTLKAGKETYLVDKDGNYYLAFGTNDDVEVGKVYYVSGVITLNKGLRETTNPAFEESTTEITAPKALDITENVSKYASNSTLEDALQNQYVKITGVASGAKELTVNGVKVALYGKNGAKVSLTTGHTYTITGYASVYNNTQIVVYSTDSIVEAELTPEQKVNATVEAIKAQFAEKFTNASTAVTLNNEFNLTITVTLGDGSILSYVDGVMTVTATATEATQTFTVKVATGTGVEKEETITVSSQTTTEKTTNLNFQTATTNLSETDSALNAELLGLDSTIFEVVYKKSGSNSSNMTKDRFKFYAKDTLTIKVKDGKTAVIKKILATAEAATGKYSLDNLTVTVNGTAVSLENGAYAINASEIVLTNTVQVRFTALSFVYDVA